MNKHSPHDQRKPLSILLIGTQMATAGAQIGLLDQARCFHAKGCRVVAVFLYDRDGLHQAWQQAAEFPIHNLNAYRPGFGALQNAVLFVKGMLALMRLMSREKFDVVETFTPDSNLVGLPIAWLKGIRVRIATHRGRIENFSHWRTILHAWVVNSGIADVLVAVSEGTRHRAHSEGMRPDKVLVIMNGVTPLDVESLDANALREKLNLKDNELFLLAAGRLVYQKGFDILIEAVPELIHHQPHLTLNICGDGPLMADLQSRISNLGLSDHVKLLGICSNMAELLAVADIFVLSSRFEGLSRAMLEAMAAGVPVVATRVEGVEEVIIDGVHGLLATPENSYALSKALIQMVDQPEMRKKMGAAAREQVMKSYTTDAMFEKYYELIVHLLEAK